MTEENSARRKKLVFLSAVIIFFYALGLRLTYVETAIIASPIRADAAKYVAIAENLIHHGAYSTEKNPPLIPDVYITPGYPLFLASILKLSPDFAFAYKTIQRLQALLSAITAVIVFLIGIEFLPLLGAFLVGCLMIISSHAVILSGYVLTETLFTFLLYIALYCAIKGFRNTSLKWFAWFGVFAGAASLVRPALFLFPFLIMLLIWRYLPIKTKRLKACCILLLTFMVLQAPWFAWKQANSVKGGISPSASSLALGTYPDLIYKDPALRGVPYREDPEYDKMSRSAEATIQILLQRAKKEPWTYVKWYVFEKPALFWSFSTIFGQKGPFIYEVFYCIYYNYSILEQSMYFLLWMHPFFLISACISIIFLLSGFAKRNQPYCSGPGIQIVALCALYFTAIHSILAPLPRYSMPLHGALYLLGTCGLVCIAGFIKNKYLNHRQHSLQ